MERILIVDAAENYRQMIKKRYNDSVCAISIDDARKKVSALKGDKDLSIVVMEITGITTLKSSLPEFVNDMRARQEQYLPFVALTNETKAEALRKIDELGFDALFNKINYQQMFKSLELLVLHSEHYRHNPLISFKTINSRKEEYYEQRHRLGF